MSPSKGKTLLAGDIGGTKTLLRLARVEGDGVRTLCQQRFASTGFSRFEELLSRFLSDCGAAEIHAACLAVAGPVESAQDHQTAQVTNLPWRLDSGEYARRFAIPRVCLINDFAAVACGIDALDEEMLCTLQAGKRRPGAPVLVAGAGTGFGVALRIENGQRFEFNQEILPSEAGHSDFAPASPLLAELARFLREKQGRCAVEDVLSGAGLENIHAFLRHREGRAPMRGTEPETAPAISQAAERGDSLACRALALFCTAYGTTVGNLALCSLPRGGVYIAGGIAPRIIRFLQAGGFMTAFRDKGKMSDLMETFPVAVIMNPEVGLLGAQRCAERLASQ